MEFRFRAAERKNNNFKSSPNHYFSSSTSVTYSTQQAGFGTGSLIDGPPTIPGQYLLEKIRQERMREEMLAKEIARKRMLEEEILREMEISQHFPMNIVEEGDYRFDKRFEPVFEGPLSIRNDDDGGDGWFESFDEYKGVEFGSVKPMIPSSREMPDISLDMKFPANKLRGAKRKASTPNQKKLAKKDCTNHKTSKKAWSCSLCCVTATSRKDLNRHLKGKKHILKAAGLMKATPSSNSTVDSSIEDDCDKLFDKEKHITSSAHADGKVTSRNSIEKGISVIVGANDEMQKMGEDHQYGKKKRWWCKLCKVNCNSEAMLHFHYGGKKHEARLET